MCEQMGNVKGPEMTFRQRNEKKKRKEKNRKKETVEHSPKIHQDNTRWVNIPTVITTTDVDHKTSHDYHW